MALRLYIDTYTQEIWRLPTRAPVLRFAFQRGATEAIDVQAVTDGVTAALGGTPTLSFKTAPTDASFLIATVTGTASGSGTSAKHTFLPLFSSAALDTLLGSSLSASCYGEIKWTEGSATNIVGPFLCRIYGNLNRGGETTPGVVTSASAQVLPTITSFTGSSATDLPYVPTVSLTAGTGVPFFIRISGQFIPVYLDSGTANVLDPGEVAPLDYNVSTNAKKWVRGS
jgi:hypothetical protein